MRARTGDRQCESPASNATRVRRAAGFQLQRTGFPFGSAETGKTGAQAPEAHLRNQTIMGFLLDGDRRSVILAPTDGAGHGLQNCLFG